MPRPWAVDLASGESMGKEMPKPPGYSELFREEQVARPCAARARRIVRVCHGCGMRAQESRIEKKRIDQVQLKLKKAKELAWSPAKSFMMTGFMLWMSGNGVHIFPIMITFYAIYNPIKSAFTVGTVFRRFDDAKMTDADRTNILFCKARRHRTRRPRRPRRPPPTTRAGDLRADEHGRHERRALQDVAHGAVADDAVRLGLLPRRARRAAVRGGRHRFNIARTGSRLAARRRRVAERVISAAPCPPVYNCARRQIPFILDAHRTLWRR